MDRVVLLAVTDTFQLSGIGLTLMPDFSVPDGWRNRVETVTVETPDAGSFEATAQFNITHFNIPGSVDVDRRWRVLVTLPEIPKERVPVGSRILVSPATKAALLNGG